MHCLPLPLPTPLPVRTLSPFLSLPVCRRSSFLTRGEGGLGAKSYNREKTYVVLYKSYNTLWRHRTTLLAELTDSLIWSLSVMKAVQRLYLHNSYRSRVFCMDPEVFSSAASKMLKQHPRIFLFYAYYLPHTQI